MYFNYIEKANSKKRSLASVLLISIILFMIISYVTALFSFNNYYQEFGWKHASAQYGGGGGGGGGTPPPSIPSVAAINVVTPEEGYDLLKDLSPAIIADILSEVEATKSALILELFDSETAFQILQEMSLATAANLVNLMEPANAIMILEMFDAETALQILQEMTSDNAGKLVNLMDSVKASAILSLIGEGDGEIIQNMVNDNSTLAAQRVDEAVKMITEGLEGQARQDALSGLIDALSEVDKMVLVELLTEIALLPETPQVSADIILGFTLSETIDLVSTWTSIGDLDALSSVLDHLEISLFQNLYSGLSGSERVALFTHLSTVLVEALPDVGDFAVTELGVEPEELEPGDTATISFTLTNNGDEPDVYMVTLRHEGEVLEVYNGTLDGGDSETLRESIIVGEVGEYGVEAGDLSLAYTVDQPPSPIEPADIKVQSIEIDPLTVTVGGQVSVSVSVVNEGEDEGTETLELFVDDEVVGSEDVTLAGGETDTLEFTLTAAEEEGTYSVKIGVFEDIFIVEEGAVVPWATIITLIIIIVSVGLFALIETGVIKTDILSKIRS
jgi:hypothetical protein